MVGLAKRRAATQLGVVPAGVGNGVSRAMGRLLRAVPLVDERLPTVYANYGPAEPGEAEFRPAYNAGAWGRRRQRPNHRT